MRTYKRLDFSDRQKIERMMGQGKRVIDIADEVGVHRATIYNELKRCSGKYTAEEAQKTI